jgi:glycosyltransferase involved in cell wall biosynthesis
MTTTALPPSLCVVCLGHPLDRRTWSGTPVNLCEELKRRGALAATIDSEDYFPRPLVLGAKVFSKLYYAGSRYLRLGRPERVLRARHVRRCLPASGISHVLHLNAHALPDNGPKKDAGCQRRDYLFTDTTWNLWRQYATDMDSVNGRLDRDAEALERIAYHQATHIFAISAYLKRNLTEHYGVSPDKITVVGTGRGAIVPFLGEKDYSNGTILFVAKERFRDKGGEALLAGFRLARRTNPALNLTIVGSDDYHGLAVAGENITTHGRLPLPELQNLFNRASLYAMPAQNEPWGLVYLEALACKTPILGLDRLSIPEITRDGRLGFCLESTEPEVVAAALLQAFSDPARLAAMGEEGHHYSVENFSWERTVERILEVVSARYNG